MPQFTFPTAAELIRIAAEKMPTLVLNDPIFQLFPIRSVDTPLIIWDQDDMYGGLQAVRGIDGAPSRVKAVGSKRFIAEPGYYGEFMTIDEQELTMRASGADPMRPVSLDELVMTRQDQLLNRRVNRIRYIAWTLALTGIFSVARNNIVMHTDRYTPRTFTPLIPWTTTATATPLADLRTIQLLSRGTGADFGSGATIWLARVMANALFSNTNNADLGGRFFLKDTVNPIINMDTVNRILMGEGLPQINVYDEGYFANDDGTGFTPWIPDTKGLLVGKRAQGQTIGEYRMTRNVNNPNFEPGAYMYVIDRGLPGSGQQLPRTVEVHDGHNGGPVLYYPGSVIILNIG